MLVIISALFMFQWVFSPEMTFFMDDWHWLHRSLFTPWSSYLSIWTILPAALYADRPVEALIFKLLYELFGLNYSSYGAILLSIHIANGILVYFLMVRILASRFYAVLVAMFFTVSVIVACPAWWAATVSDSAALLFCLASFLSFLGKRRGATVLTVIFYYLSTRAKESTLPFPFLLLAYSFLTTFAPPRLETASKALARAIRSTFPVLFMFFILFSFSMYYFTVAKLAAANFGPYLPKFNFLTMVDGTKIYLSYIAFQFLSQSQVLVPFFLLALWGFLTWNRAAIIGFLGFFVVLAPVLVLASQRVPYYAYPGSIFVALMAAAAIQSINVKLAKKLGERADIALKTSLLVGLMFFINNFYRSGMIRETTLATMRHNSKTLKSLQATLTHVENNSKIIITGLNSAPLTHLFASAGCTALTVIYKIENIDCQTGGTSEELQAIYEKAEPPKILLNYLDGGVSLVASSQ